MMKARNSASQEGGFGRKELADMLMSSAVSDSRLRVADADGKKG